MTHFSLLTRRFAGQITLAAQISLAVSGGALIYGIYSIHESGIENLLKDKATHMAQETSYFSKINAYLDAESQRLEQAHQTNLVLLQKAESISPWLTSTAGSPTVEDLRKEEADNYFKAFNRLASEKKDVHLVSQAIMSPENIPALKEGLTPSKLETYSSVKDCALRGAGQGAYCGPSAAIGARLNLALKSAEQLALQAEAHARENLGYGWDQWDDAQSNLTQAAFSEIDQARQQAFKSYQNGDLDSDDWDSMNKGFTQAEITAREQIQHDRDDLQAQVHAGNISGYNWYLLSRWTQSSPLTVVHIVHNPYVVGGSSFVNPTTLYSPIPSPAPSTSHFSTLSSPPVVTPTHSTASSLNSHSTTALQSAPAPAPAPVAKAPVSKLASPGSYAPKILPPSGVNPYSVSSATTHLGSKVNASFSRAAGPKIASLASQGGLSSRGGIAARVASISAGRAFASGRAAVSVGHAGVSSSSGHGSSGG